MAAVNELEANLLSIWLEGFFYGKLCALTCTLDKEVQLFPGPGLGLYSGIFAIYLQCQSEKSRSKTAIFLFYAVCLLYVLCAASFVSDLVALILEVSKNSIYSIKILFFISVVQTHIATLPHQLQIDSQTIVLRILRVQVTVYGCCDFLAQCILVRINHCTC